MEAEDTHDDETDEPHASEARGFVEQDDPQRRGPHRADTGPDGVGRPHREVLDRLRQQHHTEDDRDGRSERRERSREPVGVDQPDRPHHLEQPRDEQHVPRHTDEEWGERLCFSFRVDRFALCDSRSGWLSLI